MSQISGKNILKTYGIQTILSGLNFNIEKGDRIGVVGPNGAGKTTLMNIIAGETECDDGHIVTAQDTKIGYLKQTVEKDREKTVREKVEEIFAEIYELEKKMEDLSEKIALSGSRGQDIGRLTTALEAAGQKYEELGGYTYKSRIKAILSGTALGGEYIDKRIGSLSGGEKTRLALACTLMQRPDVLILDEPTNHLDIGTVKWLEQYLCNLDATIVVVSHDRYFLDKLVNRIFHIEGGKLEIYTGNYSRYSKQRTERREVEAKHYEAQQREIRRQEDLVRSYKQRGTEKLAKRAASREKVLEKLKLKQVGAPLRERRKMKIEFKEGFESGNDVIFAQGLAKSFNNGESGIIALFENVDLDIKRGEKIAILGANGIGKTTLLKIIIGSIIPDSGRIRKGYNVKIAYYDQEQRLLNEDSTVIDEIHSDYTDYTQGELRNLLGRFLFTGDDVFNKVSTLSGGEKVRLSLLKIMLSGANLLIMDEPTNHLDIEAEDMFEEALAAFPGTAIIVSHDRYFLSRIPDRILELTSQGIEEYPGKYDYYEEKRSKIKSGAEYLKKMADTGMQGGARGESRKFGQEEPCIEDGEESLPGALPESVSKYERRLKKEEEARLRRMQRERDKLESEIERLEAKQQELEADMCEASESGDIEKLNSLNAELQIIKDRLQNCYDEWITCS